MKRSLKKKVKKHLKEDAQMFKKEAREDEKLLKMLKDHFSENARVKKADKRLIKKGRKEEKIADVMEEFKEGELRSGSKKGPKVTSRKQALAIALSEARKMKKKKRK